MVKDPMDGYWQEQNTFSLREHLIRSSEIVNSWPSWKREYAKTMLNTEDRTVEHVTPATDSLINQCEASNAST